MLLDFTSVHAAVSSILVLLAKSVMVGTVKLPFLVLLPDVLAARFAWPTIALLLNVQAQLHAPLTKFAMLVDVEIETALKLLAPTQLTLVKMDFVTENSIVFAASSNLRSSEITVL